GLEGGRAVGAEVVGVGAAVLPLRRHGEAVRIGAGRPVGGLDDEAAGDVHVAPAVAALDGVERNAGGGDAGVVDGVGGRAAVAGGEDGEGGEEEGRAL